MISLFTLNILVTGVFFGGWLLDRQGGYKGQASVRKVKFKVIYFVYIHAIYRIFFAKLCSLLS